MAANVNVYVYLPSLCSLTVETNKQLSIAGPRWCDAVSGSHENWKILV